MDWNDCRDDIEGFDASAAHIANLLSSESSDVKVGIGGFSMGARMLALKKMLRPRQIQRHPYRSRQLSSTSMAPLLKDAEGQDGGLTHGSKKSRRPAHPAQPWQR
ncbi:hypothetical protein ZWY2020_047952 [Hordeum vulgare]|nr:hypothetical protein ZWY2020_047952 [Hordeum vulgare]